jgi:hypothetical protein
LNYVLRRAYDAEIAEANTQCAAGNLDAAFAHLERAHILGQRFLIPHAWTNIRMLAIGLRRADGREIVGQFLRLFATIPGYAFGWVPKGNTGGANVSAVRPMPLPDDLQPLLANYDVWRDAIIRAAIWLAVATFWLFRP